MNLGPMLDLIFYGYDMTRDFIEMRVGTTRCLEVAQEFCYSVEFSGVGDPPSGQEGLGHCSQIATFTSMGTPLNDEKKQLNTPYTVVR